MSHHTRFVKRWLTIEDEHITITEVSVNFFVYGGRPRGKCKAICCVPTVLWRRELIGNSRPLLDGKFVLAWIRRILLYYRGG